MTGEAVITAAHGQSNEGAQEKEEEISEKLKVHTESDLQVLQMDCHNHMRNIFVAKTVTNALDPTVSVKASHLASA